MVNYTLTLKQDVYYITNNEIADISYKIERIDECTEDSLLSEGVITPAEKKALPLVADGIYSVTLTNEALEVTVVPPIKYYFNLETSMIEDVLLSLCDKGCGCNDCAGLAGDACCKLIDTLGRIEVFSRLTSPKFDLYIKAANDSLTCLISPQIYCDIGNESVTGVDACNEELSRQLIAIDYLTFYYSQYFELELEEDITYLDTKYNSKTILCLINKLGIDISAVKSLIEQGKPLDCNMVLTAESVSSCNIAAIVIEV